jgi:hypothetical protein
VTIGLVLVTESERTQRLITMLIFALLIVGVLLIALTIWYWRHTNPKRYVRRVFPQPEGPDLDLRRRYASPPGPGPAPGQVDPGTGSGGYAERHYSDPYGRDPYGRDARVVETRASGPTAGPHIGSGRRVLLEDDYRPGRSPDR